MSDLEKQSSVNKANTNWVPRRRHLCGVALSIFIFAVWIMITEINKVHKATCSRTADVMCTADQSCCGYQFKLSYMVDQEAFSMVTEEGSCCGNDCDRMNNYLQQLPCRYNIEKPTSIYTDEEPVPWTNTMDIATLVYGVLLMTGMMLPLCYM